MSGRNLQDYVEVRDRIEKFWADHPEGRILPEMLIANEQIVRFRVEVYIDRDDPRPASVGHAEEVRSDRGVNATSAVENCETSAIGRALANLGMHLSKHRASREEMAKVQRYEDDDGNAASQPRSAPPARLPAPAATTQPAPPQGQPAALATPALAPDDPLAGVVAKLRAMETNGETWDAIREYGVTHWQLADAYGRQIITATMEAIKTRRQPAPAAPVYAGMNG